MKNEHLLIPYLADLDIQIDYVRHRVYFNTAELYVVCKDSCDTGSTWCWIPIRLLKGVHTSEIRIQIPGGHGEFDLDMEVVTTVSRIVALHLYNAESTYELNPVYDRFSTYDCSQPVNARVRFAGHGKMNDGQMRKLYWEHRRLSACLALEATSDVPPFDADGAYHGVSFLNAYAALDSYVTVVSTYWRDNKAAPGSANIVQELLYTETLLRDPESGLEARDWNACTGEEVDPDDPDATVGFQEEFEPEAEFLEPEFDVDPDQCYEGPDVLEEAPELDLSIGAVVALRGQPDIRFTVGPNASFYRVREDGTVVCVLLPDNGMLVNPELEASIDLKLAAIQEVLDIRLDAMHSDFSHAIDDLHTLVNNLRPVLNTEAEIVH